MKSINLELKTAKILGNNYEVGIIKEVWVDQKGILCATDGYQIECYGFYKDTGNFYGVARYLLGNDTLSINFSDILKLYK